MKKILLLGVTGRIGHIVLKNLLRDDVKIKVYVRSPEKLEKDIVKNIEIARGDILDTSSLHKAMQGIDIVITAVNGNLLAEAQSIVKAMSGTDVSRVIGGHWHGHSS